MELGGGCTADGISGSEKGLDKFINKSPKCRPRQPGCINCGYWGGWEERTSENDWAHALSLNSHSCHHQEQVQQWADPRGHFCL